MKKYLTIIISLVLMISAISACTLGSKNTDNNSNANTVGENDSKEDSAKSDNSKENTVANNGKKLSVVTTIFPPYDFTRQIGGGQVDVKMLLKPGAESHSYEPTPQDIITIQSSDLFIYTGGENDTWVKKIIESMGDDAPETMKLIDLVDTVDEEIVEGMEHDHDHDHDDKDVHDDHDHDHDDKDVHDDHDHDHDDKAAHDDHDHDHDDKDVHDDHDHDHDDKDAHDDHDHDHDDKDAHDDHDHDHDDKDAHDDHEHVHEVDEHVWTSPENAIKIVKKITDFLSEKDSENKELYQKNRDEYIKQLEKLDEQFENIVDGAKRKTILFGDRFPFRYFADEYDLDYYAAFSGCSTDTEASAATVAFLINKVKELELPVVFSIELSNEKIVDSIVEATGAKKLTFHSIHNLSVEELEAGETYISLMEKNLEALKEALN